MKRYGHSVVIGKFYPPHRGHKLLIDTALSRSDRVSVIVVFRPDQAIPVGLRADWLRQIHPQAEVIPVDASGMPTDGARLWAEAAIRWLGGRRPDAAFSSESYGGPWCREMGCDHVMVDQARIAVPISGTKIRENPLSALDYLEPPVRAYFLSTPFPLAGVGRSV